MCKTLLLSPLHYTDTLEAKQYCMLIFFLYSNIIHRTIVGKFDSTNMNILLDTFEIILFIYMLTWKQTDTVIFSYLNNIINDWIQLMKIFIYFALFLLRFLLLILYHWESSRRQLHLLALWVQYRQNNIEKSVVDNNFMYCWREPEPTDDVDTLVNR